MLIVPQYPVIPRVLLVQIILKVLVHFILNAQQKLVLEEHIVKMMDTLYVPMVMVDLHVESPVSGLILTQKFFPEQTL